MPEYDIAVIGAGGGGLSVAAGGATLGAKVVIVEKEKQMGGDCLHYGCVPSKTLIHSAYIAHTIKNAQQFGIESHTPKFDMKHVTDRVQSVIQSIQPHDSVERFEELGCEVLVSSTGEFIDRETFEIKTGTHKGKKITAKNFVLATGSRAYIPNIKGIEDVPYLTNETLFSLKETPKKMLIVGGGPIGSEMAHAFQRLGAEVTVIVGPDTTILSKDDPEASAVVMKQMTDEGVQFVTEASAKSVKKTDDGMMELMVKKTDGSKEIKKYSGDTLLIATGRQPNVEHLGLENAGVQYDRRIVVNEKLQTSNSKIYSCGDASSRLQFTHIAGYQAGIVLRNILSPIALAKANHDYVPWVTYTDPELAQIGLNEPRAKKEGIPHKVYKFDFSGNDRAKAEGSTGGFIKVICSPKGKILGTTIVGRSAGELLGTWIIALNQGLKIGDVYNTIFPYPTLGEISKQVAGQSLKESFTPGKKKFLKKLLRLRGE